MSKNSYTNKHGTNKEYWKVSYEKKCPNSSDAFLENIFNITPEDFEKQIEALPIEKKKAFLSSILSVCLGIIFIISIIALIPFCLWNFLIPTIFNFYSLPHLNYIFSFFLTYLFILFNLTD